MWGHFTSIMSEGVGLTHLTKTGRKAFLTLVVYLCDALLIATLAAPQGLIDHRYHPGLPGETKDTATIFYYTGDPSTTCL